MKNEFVVQLYINRLRNVQNVIDNCAPDSWAEKYWIKVYNKLQYNLDNYLVDEGVFE